MLFTEKQLTKDYQPRIIQLYFDGVEVLQIVDGEKIYEQQVAINYEPRLIEMHWDEQLVYALKLPESSEQNSEQPYVLVNRMLLMMGEG